MSDAFAFFDPDTSSWKTFQVSLLTQQWDEFLETWPRAGMMQNGTVFPRQPLAPITGGIESGLLPTPVTYDATLGGPNNHSCATEADHPKGPGSKQKGLRAEAMKWPTPNAAPGTSDLNWEATDGRTKPNKLGWAVRTSLFPTPTTRDYKDGSAQSCQNVPVNGLLGLAVHQWPTPSSNNGTGGATGLAGGSGNRQKLYKMLGKEEGKKLGCQSLNPYWVEWLMGFPLGWTDCRASATRSSRKSSSGLGGKFLKRKEKHEH